MRLRTAISFFAAILSLPISAQLVLRPGADAEPLHVYVNPDLPRSVDNSNSKYFPPIISQYGGSCAQACGIHYIFTYQMNRLLDRDASLSENVFSYRQMWHFLNGGTGEGGFISDGLTITKNSGCLSNAWYKNESESTYRWVTGYDAWFDACHYKTKSLQYIDLKTQGGIEKCKNYLYDEGDGLAGGGVVGVSLTTYDWGVMDYDGPQQTGYDAVIVLKGSYGAHAVTVVGYDLDVEFDADGDGVISDIEHGAFIMMNSWGSWWGSEGRAYIPFSYFLMPQSERGLSEGDATAICASVQYCNPKIVFGVNVNYSSRNDLIFELGVADGADATQPLTAARVIPSIAHNQGGDLFMQGWSQEAAKGIELAFDYSSRVAAVDTMKAPCYFLTVTRNRVGSELGEGFVRRFSVNDYRSGKRVSYTCQLGETEGELKGCSVYRLPTLPYIRDLSGRWTKPVSTSASKAFNGRVNDKKCMAIRNSDGSVSAIRIDGYDAVSGKLKVNLHTWR